MFGHLTPHAADGDPLDVEVARAVACAGAGGGVGGKSLGRGVIPPVDRLDRALADWALADWALADWAPADWAIASGGAFDVASRDHAIETRCFDGGQVDVELAGKTAHDGRHHGWSPALRCGAGARRRPPTSAALGSRAVTHEHTAGTVGLGGRRGGR
jgi:hypothetical protein